MYETETMETVNEKQIKETETNTTTDLKSNFGNTHIECTNIKHA